MSYPYGQFTAGDNYSTPTTPIDGFPQWETVEREQEQQQLQQLPQPPHPQSQQSQEQQLHHSPTQPTPTFQLIHLEDTHSQPHEPSGSHEYGTVDDTPIHLHHVHDDPARSVDVSSSASASANVSGATKQAAAGATGSSSMVMRSARSTRQFSHSSHPYQRQTTTTPGAGPSGTSSAVPAAAGPSTGTGSTARSLMREAQVSGPGPLRFVHHNLLPSVPPLPVSSSMSSGGASAPASVVPSAMHSPAIPSPVASTSARLVGTTGSVAGSPLAQLQQSALMHASPLIPDNPPSSAQLQHKKYIIRADTHYEPDTGVLLVLLELPGVDKKDVKLSLVTSRHNRIRHLKVWGILNQTLPAPSAEVLRLYPESCARERKFGEFSRTFAVPPDLKREHVQAVMKKGLLTLKIQLGPPADAQDVQEIPVN